MDNVLHTLWHVFAAWLVIAMPLLGVWSYRRFLRRLEADPRVRERYYLSTMWQEWLLVAVLAVLLLKTPAPFSSIGFRWPGGEAPELGWALAGGGVLGCALSAVAARVGSYQRRAEQKLKPVSAFLPATTRERWLWAGVSLTAGVCEEVLYRGFLILYIGHYLPSLHPAAIAVVAGIAFGLAHAYQGLKGVLATGVMGILLGLVYWQTGSLLPLIVLHVIIDLRVLFVWRGSAEPDEVVA